MMLETTNIAQHSALVENETRRHKAFQSSVDCGHSSAQPLAIFHPTAFLDLLVNLPPLCSLAVISAPTPISTRQSLHWRHRLPRTLSAARIDHPGPSTHGSASPSALFLMHQVGDRARWRPRSH